jgi:hypothetical protein
MQGKKVFMQKYYKSYKIKNKEVWKKSGIQKFFCYAVY